MERKLANWLDSYMEYTSEQESPEEFHRWTGLAVMSAALGRHIWLDRGYYTIYPNLYVILVAGSAKCRKSVSSHIGINLLNELKVKPMIFSQKITNEALIKALLDAKIDNQSAGIIYASELSVFMGKDAISSGLIPTLTDLYDSPKKWTYHTRTRGLEIIENVSVCMLAASTMDWLKTSIPIDAVGGGFTSRVIFVYQEKPRRAILFPRRAENFAKLQADLVHDLDHIRSQRGQMDLSPEAMEFAEVWYKEEINKNHDARLEGYFGRKHDTMFKLAMVLAMAESDERWVQQHHVATALEMLYKNEPSLMNIISAVTSNEVGEKSDKMLVMIRKAGQITHSDLIRQCWRMGNSLELAEHVKTLIEAGEITQQIEGASGKRVYIAVKKW